MKEVDARGLSCPQPVILTTKAITDGTFPFAVLVDTVTSMENVMRLAQKKGCRVETSPVNDYYSVHVEKP